MQVHSGLGPGFPEDYYQRALEYEFKAQDIPFEAQKPVQVLYKGVQVGLNYLDFVIDESVVLEIKSAGHLDEIHRAQVIKYLAATNYSIALLVNFGRSSLEHERILPPKKIQDFKKRTAE
jgi:GxxExxY protein